ncbi:MAG TPA: nucleotide exchange factor GrpE [Tepidisphaeraceae bacterium]|jgi:molecular chaperone GrpE|nr:nucleotide exchange factor GrpE [Tepidisphaeraceae bacterium]
MRPTHTEPNADSPTDPNADRLRQERDALQQERDGLFDRLARTTADFQNARRRLEADKDQSVAFANSSLIKSLLPVMDNFERAVAVEAAAADAATILKGMQIVHDQWMTVLKSQFVEVIAPEPGTPFDPATMEALIHQPAEEFPPNSVTQLLQKGYSLHGRTLRPAQVAVSKAE